MEKNSSSVFALQKKGVDYLSRLMRCPLCSTIFKKLHNSTEGNKEGSFAAFVRDGPVGPNKSHPGTQDPSNEAPKTTFIWWMLNCCCHTLQAVLHVLDEPTSEPCRGSTKRKVWGRGSNGSSPSPATRRKARKQSRAGRVNGGARGTQRSYKDLADGFLQYS